MTKLYVHLGRSGDIMSLLPLLYQDFQQSAKAIGTPGMGVASRLMVAAEYKSLLEGVSYVEPVIYNGPHYELDKAVALAKTMSDDVVATQFNAPRGAVDAVTRSQKPGQATSFEKDSWRVAGRLKDWDDCYPLVFDRRDKARETKLLREHDLIKRGKQKPLMLLALEGKSSPFPYADLLRELVTNRFKDEYRILELPQAERIYDLLAIYERASLLIAIDSAPLHLAWACRKLPVFALTQDKPSLWHGSSWRPNHLWFCRYHDWPVRAMEMVGNIQYLKGYTAPYLNGTSPCASLNVWSEYPTRRKLTPCIGWLPIQRGMCGRDSGNTLKDPIAHPYLKDVVRMAMQRVQTEDMPIVLTRPNVRLANAQFGMPAFAYRMFPSEYGPQFMPVADLFCATKAWWKSILPEIPDLVLNNDHYWSAALQILFQSKGAADTTGCCTFIPDKK